jgi:hypothetical protein
MVRVCARDVSLGGCPENDAQRTVGFYSQACGQKSSGCIIGQQPIRRALDCQGQRLGLSGVEQTGLQPTLSLL